MTMETEANSGLQPGRNFPRARGVVAGHAVRSISITNPADRKPIDLLAPRIWTQMEQVDEEQGLVRSNQVIRRPEHEVKKPWTRRNLHDGILVLAPYYHRSANVAIFATPLSCRDAKRGIVQ